MNLKLPILDKLLWLVWNGLGVHVADASLGEAVAAVMISVHFYFGV
jgi:hypothetical protein